jgi:hypothetical protein
MIPLRFLTVVAVFARPGVLQHQHDSAHDHRQHDDKPAAAEHPNDVADDHELVASDPAGPDAFNP